MTDLPSNTDELISAYLDGTATPDERAQVERDPTLAGRLAELSAAQAAVAAPVVLPPDDVLDRMIATALAADRTPVAGEAGDTGDADDAEPGAPVASLAAARSRRNGARWLSAAAVLLVFVLAVPVVVALVRRHDSGSSTDVAASVASSTSTASPSPAGATPPSSDGASTTTSASETKSSGSPAAPLSQTAEIAAGDLGSASTEDDVRLLLTDALTSPADVSSTTTEAASGPTTTVAVGTTRAVDLASCEPVAQAAVPDAQKLRLSGQLTYVGVPAYGYVFTTPTGLTGVVVSSDPAHGCEILAVVTL